MRVAVGHARHFHNALIVLQETKIFRGEHHRVRVTAVVVFQNVGLLHRLINVVGGDVDDVIGRMQGLHINPGAAEKTIAFGFF